MEYNAEYWSEMLDEIMDCFDFEKVHKCMIALDWTWHGGGVPELYQLKKRARQLLKECIETNCGCNATGGFKATIDKEDGVLSLEFIVSDWDAYKEIDSDTD